jgi:glycosyltransferase involved in cell wall biosynthesis
LTQYPRITIITPSYNQGAFIEQTILSVITQNYPNLEYIVIDGGSTDNTLAILQKYNDSIDYWVSEADRGQTHAINKGLFVATGEIIAYLNSDDYYLPGSLMAVAQHFQQFPETDLLHGRCLYVNQDGETIGEQLGDINRFDQIIDLWNVWWKDRQFVQPEVFWSKRICQVVGNFDESLFYAMDYNYWCRILMTGGVVKRIEQNLACFRKTDYQKSKASQKVAMELLNVVQPWLWSLNTPLSRQKRLVLQAQWLYQAKFLTQIEQCIQQQNRPWLRWLSTSITIFKYPQIMLSPSFQKRANRWFIRRVGEVQ